MEKALILSPSLRAKYGAAALKKYDTVCLGDEFCIHKQPSFADLAAVKKLTGKTPVLVSTLLTEPALERWAALLAECAKKEPGAEIVVNDLGLLHFINKKYRGRFRVTLGRLMTYFFDRKKMLAPGSEAGLGLEGERPETWESGIDVTPVDYLKGFLKRYAVGRVETDNEHLLRKYADNTDVKISFHYPLSLMALTRFCPFKGGLTLDCKAPCGERLLKLSSRHLDYPLYSKGNAYFVKNKLVKHPRVDRAVFTPSVNSPGFKMAINEGSIRG